MYVILPSHVEVGTWKIVSLKGISYHVSTVPARSRYRFTVHLTYEKISYANLGLEIGIDEALR